MNESFNWTPLSRWERFVRFFTQYINPYRECMWCGKRFFNGDFWRLYSIRWGIPEYCSLQCAHEECDFLAEEDDDSEDWDNDDWNNDWLCACGEWVDGDEYVHCPRCGSAPPWGCGGCALCDADDEDRNPYDDFYEEHGD